MYAGPFGIETHKTPRQKKEFVLMNLPYYLAGQLPKYLDYFVQKHSISEAYSGPKNPIEIGIDWQVHILVQKTHA